MRAFYGGQIKEQFRGDLAVVARISGDRKRYELFINPILSDDFNYLTGVGSARDFPDRVYIGVSHEASAKIAELVCDQPPENLSLGSIDNMFVNPFCIKNNQEKPPKIVLESTETGYRIVEGN